MKKTLSLVLVLAMVFSFFGFAGAAFTDAADVQYTDAVEVMTGIGAINGMGDGTFAPKGDITRAQAAKMLAYTVLGADVAKMLPVSASSFKDVDANFAWAIPSIEYLASKGIINGRGDGTFDPNGKVTAYELAKMLLVANGFKGEYTGNSWALNVAIDAKNAGIFTGSKAADYNAAATREEAALYCFNGIQYSAQGTTDIYVVTVGGVKTTFKTFADAYLFYTAADGEKTLTKDTESKGSIADKVYSMTKSATTDDFGRTSTVYTNGATGTAKKTYASIENTAALTYTTAVKTGTIYKDLKLTSGTNGTTVAKENVLTNGAAAASDVVVNYNGQTVLGGNGLTTQVYTDAEGNPSKIVVIKPTFAQVTAIANAKESNGSTYTKYTIGGEVYKVYTNAVNNEKNTVSFSGTVAKGDFVTLYKSEKAAAADVTYVTPVTLITGKLTSSSTATNSYTIEGKQYQLSNVTGAEAPTGYNTVATYAIDAYGYVIKAVTVTVPTNYVYLVADGKTSMSLVDNELVTSIVANGMFTDGSVVKMVVAAVGKAEATTSNVKTGLYTYSVNAKGAYILTAVTAATNETLSPKNPLVADGKYANAATKFVYSNWTKDADNKVVFAGNTTVITGFNNIPAATGVTGAYIDADGNGIVEVVFVNAKTAVAVSANYAFYLGTKSTTDGATFAYDFIVNGELTTITGLTTPPDKAGLYIITAGVAGLVDFDEDVELSLTGTAKDGIYGAKSIVNNGGLLYINGVYETVVGSTVPVYTITTSGTPGASVGTFADLTSPVTGNIVVVQANGAVTAIYILAA